MRLLLLSNSTTNGRTYLSHALDAIEDHLAGCDRVVFIPCALADHDRYAATVADALAPRGIQVTSLHRAEDPAAAIRDAPAIFVGGGNTFRLLRSLRRQGLLQLIQDQVRKDGRPYIGSSAGTNLACPTICTTNDMPILDPGGFDALGLIPFQINPHYLDPDPHSTHQGETRQKRIAEFCEENDVPVLAMREGAWLRVDGTRATLDGTNGALLFTATQAARSLTPAEDVSFLLTCQPRFETSTRTAGA